MSLLALNNKTNAITLAGRGWHIHPILPLKKRPASPHGLLDATTDTGVIEAWWRDMALANIGISTGPSGLLVVDVDMNPWKAKQGAASWEALMAQHEHVETYTVRTWSGGLHFYYKAPEGGLRSTSDVLGPDIDTRGLGGYVVAAGSKVSEDGHKGEYVVEHDAPIADCPAWIVEALQKPEPKPFAGTGQVAASGAVVARVRSLAGDLASCTIGANDRAASLSTMVGNYVGAGQIDHAEAVTMMKTAVSDWTWAKPEDRETMHNTIERQVAFGAQRSDRPWEAPVTNALRDPYDTKPVLERPHLAAVPDDPTAPEPVREIGHGQYRMAQRMLHESGDDLRYSSALGWYSYDGTRWAPDEDKAVFRAAQASINRAYADVPSQSDSDARKDLVRDIVKVESASGVNGMLEHLAAMRPVAAGRDPFDQDAHLFNTPSGVVDLLAAETREHRREDMVSKIAGADIGTESGTAFEAFLARTLPDVEVRQYVQRLLGQAMLGQVREHILPIFTGKGANGKGTLRDAVLHAFGDYALEVAPDILMEQKNAQHKTFLLELRGRRLVFCSEGDKSGKFAEATMKRLVGGDPIQANRMHHDPITFLPTHTLILLTNYLPEVSGDDAAIWRRIQVVPFDVVIPPEERDGTLPERLKAEAPAVLAWVYQGWLDYQAQGLNPPQAVLAATHRYQDESDTMGRFLEECTMESRGESIPAGALYEAYGKWSAQQGEHAETSTAFGKSLKARGVEKKKTAQGMRYQGRMLIGDFA